MRYERSAAGLVEEYRTRYESLVKLNPNIGSFDEWIRNEYNTKLKKLKSEIAGTETSAQYLKSDEYSEYKRVSLSKYMKVGVVEKNRSRAVKRLDIINDLLDRDYLTRKELISNKKAVKALYKDFINSKNVSEDTQKAVKDFINSATSSKGRAINQTILFDFNIISIILILSCYNNILIVYLNFRISIFRNKILHFCQYFNKFF